MGGVGSQPLQKLGKYEILAELGHGAMGVVYQARDPLIGRLVALKTINSSLVDRPDLLERFYQEAQSAGKLQHPNIVTIFELGQEKDTPFIAMEYLNGESLEKTIVRETDLPVAVKVGYIVRICQALEYAHKNRVVHRDIKPGNVMVNSEGVVKVVDFGIARLVDFSRTHTNMMIGTPAYMAPELFRKKKADERTDIWAVGITFYELLCYQRPFTGDGYDIIRSIMEDDYPALSSVVPECPAEVQSVIRRMLTKPSAERYQSMEDVLLDLEPVWNRLRASEAQALASRGQELYELGDLLKAQDRLRRARQIDSSNTVAKSLLEKISTELRRTEILPKMQEHVSRARNFLEAGQFPEAQSEAEAALSLDSQYEPAQRVAEEIEAATARVQQAEQKLRLAKQRLAEGALGEAESALRQALEFSAEHPQAAELRQQIAEEHARRERRKQLNELLQRARSLWTELKYDECLALLAEGMKAFPNEPELKSLQETARADQREQRKQAQVIDVRRLLGQQKLVEARQALDSLVRELPQDPTVRNLQALLAQEELEDRRKKKLAQGLADVRGLVSGRKWKEAAEKGEALLREFPQEYELLDLISYAKSELLQQEQKRKEQESEKQIRSLLSAKRFPEAADLAKRAAEEFPASDLFRRLFAEAEQKAGEQQERARLQREVQQRVQEIRSKIKRQELTDAIDLARQTLATMGPDTDLTQLLHAAEVEVQERDKKREEQKQQVQAARTMLDEGDFAGATQMLNRAIAAKTVLANDMQTKLLFAEIAEKEEARRQEEQKRKREEERKRKEAEKAAKSSRAEHPASGDAPTTLETPPAKPAPPAAPPTGSEPVTSFAASGARPKPSVPVMTPLPAAPPRPATIQTEVRVEERISIAPRAGGLLRKPAVLAAAAVVLAGSAFSIVHFWPRKASEPSAQDLALKNSAAQLWQDHKPDDALDTWKKLAGHPGALQSEAAQQVQDIEQKHLAVDQLYSQGMKLLYEAKNYPDAAQKFNQILQMNLWKMNEARKEYDVASKGPGAAPATPLWQALYDEGMQAFGNKDYPAALQNMQQAVQANGVSSDAQSKARQQIAVIQDRQEQKKNYDLARELEGSGQLQQAKSYYERVTRAPHGDRNLSSLAEKQIGAIAANVKPAVSSGENAGGTSGVATAGRNPPAVDSAAALGEVRSLIGQGRWTDAQAALGRVPASQRDYAGLKNQIDAGMQDDQTYAQRYGEYTRAHSGKNKTELLTLRPFFNDEANKPGRHSADARSVAAQIDEDVRELETVKPSTPNNVRAGNAATAGVAGTGDAAAINSILQRYAKAYDEGNVGLLRTVREYDPKVEKKLPELLAPIKGKGFTLRNCSPPQISGDTAIVGCEAILAKVKDAKPSRVNFQLKNFDGQWIIMSSN